MIPSGASWDRGWTSRRPAFLFVTRDPIEVDVPEAPGDNGLQRVEYNGSVVPRLQVFDRTRVSFAASGLTTTVTTAVRYGIWRKCQVRHNGVDVVVNGEAKSKHCYELIDDGTTGECAWVGPGRHPDPSPLNTVNSVVAI